MLPDALLHATYVTWPAAILRPAGDAIELVNDALGASLIADAAAVAVLDHFRRPRVLADALGELDVSAELLLALLRHGLVIDLDALMTPAQHPIGAPARLADLLSAAAHPAGPGTVIFGAPTDQAVSGRSGARQGPREIRAHTQLPLWPGAQAPRPFQALAGADDPLIIDLDFRRQYAGPIPPVIDVGNLEPLPGESITSYGARVHLITSLILERGGRPALLGGDHSVTAFVLDAVLERGRPFGVLHFDAHHDLTPVFAPALHYVTHGNPFLRALPSPSLVRLLQLGLRGVQPMARGQLRAEPRLTCRTARELQQLRPEEAFAGVPDDVPYYLTFDIDCMDPAVAPETGTPMAGGLSYYQAMDLVDFAARRFDLIGWDIVEVGQGDGRVNRAAGVAGELIKTLLLARAPHQPLESYLEEPGE